MRSFTFTDTPHISNSIQKPSIRSISVMGSGMPEGIPLPTSQALNHGSSS